MPSRKASNSLKSEKLTKLMKMNITPLPDLKEPASMSYSFSAKAEEWCSKLSKQIYNAIIDNKLLISPQEKT